MPRIERFHQQHPDTDVRLDTSLKLADFLTQGIDVGVRYGKGQWEGLVAEKLMDERIFPVCSPAWLAEHGPLVQPADLAGKTLLHDHSVDTQAGFASWASWLASAGAPQVDASRGMRINNSAAVLQAAIDGQGVAIARDVLAYDDVAAGRLVRLFPDIDLPSELAYFIVYRAECATLPKLNAFREWLHQEATRACSAYQDDQS